MMNLFDPTDCRAARDLIARGQDLAAAKFLLASPDKSYRTSRQMLAELQPRLIEQAKLAAEQFAWDAAFERLETAAACSDLPVEAVMLAERVRHERQQRDAQILWKQQRLQAARDLASQGRAMTACDVLRPLESLQDAVIQQERADFEERLGRCQRYLEEAHQHLEQEELAAARERLDRAREIHRAHPTLIALEERLRLAQIADEPLPDAIRGNDAAAGSSPMQIPHRSTIAKMPSRFLLNGELLVLTGHEIVIGNARGEGVAVPLTANIHSRHAIVLRNRDEYQVIALTGSKTRLNDLALVGAKPLTHGDVLQFGPLGCEWRFRLPIADSGTAILESVGSSHFGVSLPGAAACRRIVLMSDDLRLTNDEEGHYRLAELPACELRLRRESNGLTASATGGAIFIDGLGGGERLGDKTFSLPARLLIRSTLDEAEILRREVAGQIVADELRIDLRAV